MSDPLGDCLCQRLDAARVCLAKARGSWAIEIDHGDYLATAFHRNDQFGPAIRVARDVSWESMHVFDQLGLAARRRCPAYALAERDTDAGRPSDKWSKHELALDIAIEARPIEIGNEFPDQRGQVCHIGDAVALTLGKRHRSIAELAIAFFRIERSIGGEIKHDRDLARMGQTTRGIPQGPKRRTAKQLRLAHRSPIPSHMSILKKLLIALLVLVLVLGAVIWWLARGNTADLALDDVSGTDPTLLQPEAEMFPTISIAKPVGWEDGEAPAAAEGLAVGRFAEGLDHPRVLYALPNGDVLVSLTRAPKSEGGGITAWVANWLLTRAGATGVSPDEIVLLRDEDGDGVAETRKTIANDGLDSPSGIGWHDGTLYVANHDALLAFTYELGSDAVSGEPRKLMDLAPGGGHWMRNLEIHPDGDRIYVAVGSASNIGEQGMEVEEGRAMIWEYNLETNRQRPFGTGLRNANGLDFSPWSGELWTTVNERDMLGSDLVPDYLTNVPVGAQYGWPWIYWGDNYDRRVEAQIPAYLGEYARKPEYALGPHVAALGLVFTKEGHTMGENFASGAFIARHGSWNRKPPAGYDVVYIAFDERGNPQGKPVSVLGSFLNEDGTTRGRPTWVEWAGDGSLLVSDDTAGIIWRITSPGAEPGEGIARLSAGALRPQRELRGDPRAAFGEDDYAREQPAQ